MLALVRLLCWRVMTVSNHRGTHLNRLVLCALIAALAAAGCSQGSEPAAGPTTASPSPSPSPTFGAVDGLETVVVVAADPNSLVFNDRATPEPDEAAIHAFAAQVNLWLDEHLTALQDGGDGALDEVAVAGLLDGADPTVVDAVTTALASPDTPVAHARYHLVVAHSGAPVWLRAHVTTVDPDGGEHVAGFVFVPEPAGLRLIAAGPGPL